MRGHLDAGYTMIKIKVGGLPIDEDLRRVEAALAIVGSGDRLAVDANAKFNREEALIYAKALAPLKLRWFEEPVETYEEMAELTGFGVSALKMRVKRACDRLRALLEEVHHD